MKKNLRGVSFVSHVAALCVMLLSACGGGGDDGSASTASPSATPNDMTLESILKVGAKGVQVTDPPRDLVLAGTPSCTTAPGGPRDLKKLQIKDDGNVITYALEYGKFCAPSGVDYIDNYMAFDTDLNSSTGCLGVNDLGVDLTLQILVHPDLRVEAVMLSYPATCGEVGFTTTIPVTASLFIGPAGQTYLTGTIPRSAFPGASVKIGTFADQLSASFIYTFQ
jgi:hypothetical protein